MGARPYVPTLGRSSKSTPFEGGSANDYDYVSGDPVNQFDLTGDAYSEESERLCRGSGVARHVTVSVSGASSVV